MGLIFSLDSEVAAKMTGEFDEFTNEINSSFSSLQDNIYNIVIRSNYKKLLTAMNGIFEIYNTFICKDCKERLISQWEENISSFAKTMYAGDESEEVARKIESAIEDICDPKNLNKLEGLTLTGEAKATREDFEEARGFFDDFSRSINEITDEYTYRFKTYDEENNIYGFVLNIIQAISKSLEGFIKLSADKIDELKENFTELLNEQERIVSEKKSPSMPDFGDVFGDDDSSFISNSSKKISGTSGTLPSAGKNISGASGILSGTGKAIAETAGAALNAAAGAALNNAATGTALGIAAGAAALDTVAGLSNAAAASAPEELPVNSDTENLSENADTDALPVDSDMSRIAGAAALGVAGSAAAASADSGISAKAADPDTKQEYLDEDNVIELTKKEHNILKQWALNMLIPSEVTRTYMFFNLTKEFYYIICNKVPNLRKKEFTLIRAMMEIYYKFYHDYYDTVTIFSPIREDEYEGVILARKLDTYFKNADEREKFRKGFTSDISVYSSLATMVINVSRLCEEKKASQYDQLLYALTFLFYPITDGIIGINKDNSRKYAEFDKWAAEKILKMLGEEVPSMVYDELNFHEKKLDIENKYYNDLKKCALAMMYPNGFVDDFSNFTAAVFDMARSSRKVSKQYDALNMLMTIYLNFYSSYSDTICISHPINNEDYDYMIVRNEAYFANEGDKNLFMGNYTQNVRVYEKIVPMVRNIISTYRGSNNNKMLERNLYCALELLFRPIKKHFSIAYGKDERYAEFSRWAAEKTLSMLGVDIPEAVKEYVKEYKPLSEEELLEKYSNEAVSRLETYVNKITPEKFNKYISKHSNDYRSFHKGIYDKEKDDNTKEKDSENNESKAYSSKAPAKVNYGCYKLVNSQLIDEIRPLVKSTEIEYKLILNEYNKVSDKWDSGVNAISTGINIVSDVISSFMSNGKIAALCKIVNYAFDKKNKDKNEDKKEDNDTEKNSIKYDEALKLTNILAEKAKKSTILSKVKTKFWEINNENASTPYNPLKNLITQYIYEKYSMRQNQFKVFFDCLGILADENQKNVVELSLLSSNYIILMSQKFYYCSNNYYYDFFNYMRAAMEIIVEDMHQNIDPETQNELVNCALTSFESQMHIKPGIEPVWEVKSHVDIFKQR